jgi:hypothetical protein
MTVMVGGVLASVAFDRHNLDTLHAYRSDAPAPDSDDQSIAVPTDSSHLRPDRTRRRMSPDQRLPRIEPVVLHQIN